MSSVGQSRDGDAGEDENGADDAGGRQRFAEEYMCDEEGDCRYQVEAERTADRSEGFAGLVPCDEAEGASEKSQECEVPDVGQTRKTRRVGGTGKGDSA